jgi:hypothetical protein
MSRGWELGFCQRLQWFKPPLSEFIKTGGRPLLRTKSVSSELGSGGVGLLGVWCRRIRMTYVSV